ncbi:spindle assembly checkpoint kinase-like [Contarinia nasturtii]|uniref:spindle assembly checkpoint kinase-like n=1 Tax=Contarinia nasturtii TaxID=265458 RepID=UPI0012D484AF|nr:spindle assembly checkpoint kinase-like [Contarinia nasturtii]
MHGRGVIHCDIKPENILVNSDKRVKLADFGMYIIPSNNYGINVDLWNMGILCYELIEYGYSSSIIDSMKFPRLGIDKDIEGLNKLDKHLNMVWKLVKTDYLPHRNTSLMLINLSDDVHIDPLSNDQEEEMRQIRQKLFFAKADFSTKPKTPAWLI